MAAGDLKDKLTTLTYLTFNFFAVTSIVLANKQVLTLHIPVQTLTILHFIVTEAFLLICLKFNVFKMPENAKMTPLLWTVVIAKVFANTTSQYSLMWNSVGVYQLAKQGQVPVVLLLEYFLLKRSVSTQRLVLLFFLVCSVIYATVADVHFNFAGSVAAILNLFLAALEMVCLSMAQQQGEKLGSMAVMHMTLPWAIGMTACLIPVMEASQVVEVFSQEFTVPLAGMLFVSCLCAFFVNWSTALVTGKASALTYVLLGQFKTIMIMVMGIIFFDGMPTFKTICGGGVALCFLTAYSIVTMQEQAAQQASASPKEEPQGGSKKEDAV